MATDYNMNTEENTPANPSNQKGNKLSGSNKIKDPDDWTTGDEPMTDAQRSYIKTLSGGKMEENMTKAAAAKFIDEHKSKGAKITGNDGNENVHNAIKDPGDWVTGQEEMTDAQRSYLKTLSDEAGENVDENLSKAEASKQIEELQQKTGRGTKE